MVAAIFANLLFTGIVLYGGLTAFLALLFAFALGNTEVGYLRVGIVATFAVVFAYFAIESTRNFWIAICYIALCVSSYLVFHRPR